jgi:hypothetical protein
LNQSAITCISVTMRVQQCTGDLPNFKIYLVLYHLNKKSQSLYLPGQNIAIDESLTLWRGRLSFRQYVSLKASKFGIKSYELCESSSGYLWSFIIYTDKTLCSKQLTFQTPKQKRQKLLSLVEPFYNSPALAQRLKSLNTDCVGSLRL